MTYEEVEIRYNEAIQNDTDLVWLDAIRSAIAWVATEYHNVDGLGSVESYERARKEVLTQEAENHK